MTNQQMTAQRRQTFGDYGAPAACWDAWYFGGDRWTEHCKRCRDCREVERERARRDRERGRSG